MPSSFSEASACIIVASILSAVVGGQLSDRVGRKPVIYVAGTTMAVAALLLLLAPSFAVALALSVAFGLGFGAFTSVDWALGSDAMPSSAEDSAGPRWRFSLRKYVRARDARPRMPCTK